MPAGGGQEARPALLCFSGLRREACCRLACVLARRFCFCKHDDKLRAACDKLEAYLSQGQHTRQA